MLASITETVAPHRAGGRLADNHAQHVGVLREIRGRRRHSRCAQSSCGGSTPNARASVAATAAPVGVVKFHRGAARIHRAFLSSSAVAGAGTGSMPCSVLTVPLPRSSASRQCCRPPAGRTRAGAHDIGNGIRRAHFVEVHFFDGHAGGPAPRPRPVAGTRRWHCAARVRADRRLLDHLYDVRQMPVRLLFPGFHVELGGRRSRSASPFRKRRQRRYRARRWR